MKLLSGEYLVPIGHIDSGNVYTPSGNKPLTEAVLNKFLGAFINTRGSMS